MIAPKTLARMRCLPLATLMALIGACSSVPPPTPQLVQATHAPGMDQGVTGPRQKAWPWDGNRGFEGEFSYACWGPIHFVDPRNQVDSFVAIAYPPMETLDSDDSDVVLAGIFEFNHFLIYSTDGGRNFLKDARGFTYRISPEFVAVRKGHLYVGVRNHDYHGVDDGYFGWRSYSTSSGDKEPRAVDTKLVVLEASIDKARGRIGRYSVLVPKGFEFVRGMPSYAETDIKPVDDIEALNLPHREGELPRRRCGKSIEVPPWQFQWHSAEIDRYVDWYDATKKAHPGWGDAATDKFVYEELRKYQKKLH